MDTKKETYSKLKIMLTQILENDEHIKKFVLFLNRLENINKPILEISLVLHDYLQICNNQRPKGKNKIRLIEDRHLLIYNKNIGYLDVVKVEYISKAVINGSKLRVPISIHDFKRKYKKYILRNCEYALRYKKLMQSYQEENEIFELLLLKETDKTSVVSAEIVLQRDNKNIITINKDTNDDEKCR